MSFPIIMPHFFKEFSEAMKPQVPDDFCDVNITSAAVEYVLHLSCKEALQKLMDEKEALEYSMIDLPEEESRPFVEQSAKINEIYPQTRYYWQIRTLFMTVLQNREVNFEKRILLLNYALKTIQGMADGGQPELIPSFIDEFTSGRINASEILEYFKDIKPNPVYSLADGISLLKSLSRNNPAWKDVMNRIYKNLGVSGPETLSNADMKKYVARRGAYSEWAAGEKSRYIENVMINYVWFYSIPFSIPEFNFWDHFVFFCSLYNAVKVMLTCYMEDGSDEDFIKAVSSFDGALRASDPKLMNKVIIAMKGSGQDNNGDLAILTMS